MDNVVLHEDVSAFLVVFIAPFVPCVAGARLDEGQPLFDIILIIPLLVAYSANEFHIRLPLLVLNALFTREHFL